MSPDGPLPRHFAWLLRPDVRAATRSQDSPNAAFEAWWMVRGRVEYPGCAALTAHEMEWLKEPIGTISVQGLKTPLPVPRVMQLVLQYRPDVREKHAQNPPALAAWFYTAGLNEHLLLPLVDASWVRMLDGTVAVESLLAAEDLPAEAASRSAKESDSVPSVTVLMQLTWHLLDADQRAALPLHDPAARQRFMSLFFGAVGRSPALQALLARRWHAWLKQDVAGQKRPAARWQQLGLTKPAWLVPSQSVKTPKHISSAAVASSIDAARQHNGPSAADIRWTTRPFGVNLYGFAFGELGIGEDVRMAVQACEAAGIPHRVVNVDPGSQLRQADRLLADQVSRAADAAPFAFNVFCMPGFDMVGRVVMREGAEVLQGHYNIGWWPWELPVWPGRWKPAFELIDEVWAATRFTQEMYTAATQRTVTWMPLPASVDRLELVTRQALGLPEDAFIYLFVFDLNSWLTRKNPEAVIEAFQQAFPKALPPGKGKRIRQARQAPPMLVLKTMNGREGHPIWEDFKARCAEDDRIMLLDRTLDRGQVLGLVNACDAYVSLHRAEGFGRTLAEAMLLGKPVVATDFSGNTDFLTSEVGFPVRWSRRELQAGEYLFVEPDDRAWWAEPDVVHAAAQMLAARTTPNDAVYRSRLLAHAEDTFSATRVGFLMLKRLRALWQDHEVGPSTK